MFYFCLSTELIVRHFNSARLLHFFGTRSLCPKNTATVLPIQLEHLLTQWLGRLSLQPFILHLVKRNSYICIWLLRLLDRNASRLFALGGEHRLHRLLCVIVGGID